MTSVRSYHRCGSRAWAVLAGQALALHLLALAGSAFGQTYAQRPSLNFGLRPVGIVGNSQVQRNNQMESLFQQRGAPGAVYGGNASDALMSTGAGGRSSGGSFLGQSPTGGSYFLSRPGDGAFLRARSSPTYNGLDQFTTYRDAPPVQVSHRNAFMFHHMLLTVREGGTAPAMNPMFGEKIRDESTKLSLSNALPAEARLADDPVRRSYSAMLSAKIIDGRDRALAHGWELFGEKQFIRAITRFEAARAADRSCGEANVGILCAALTDKSFLMAESVLTTILTQHKGAFALDINLNARLADDYLLTDTVDLMARLARQNPDNVAVSAMHAAYLWFLGRREEALKLADRIYLEKRTSPFSVLAARMRGENTPSDADAPGI